MLSGSMMAPLDYVSDARVIADSKLLGTCLDVLLLPSWPPPRSGPVCLKGVAVFLAGASGRKQVTGAESKREAAQMR